MIKVKLRTYINLEFILKILVMNMHILFTLLLVS